MIVREVGIGPAWTPAGGPQTRPLFRAPRPFRLVCPQYRAQSSPPDLPGASRRGSGGAMMVAEIRDGMGHHSGTYRNVPDLAKQLAPVA